jgi:hypothetical protein
MNSAKDRFSELVQRLKDCPTVEAGISPKLLHETWSAFRRLDPEHGDEVTPALLVSLILFDVESFGALISDAEFRQLVAIGRSALDSYQLKTNPTNQPGKLLAATLKENEKI